MNNSWESLFKIFIIFSILFYIGCGEKDTYVQDAEKNLLKSESVNIYSIDIDKMLKDNDYYKKLHEFPFISTDANLDFRGNFPVEFYQSFKYNVIAKNISEVNFWKLRNYPYSVDVIYIKPIWLENYKYVSKDLFENICYSYNISKREQKILKWWLKNGGVLWVESGIYATGFENINRDGTINLKAIKNRIYRLTNGLHFLHFPIKTVVYISKHKELTTYKKYIINFNHLKINDEYFSDIKLLQIKLDHPIEAFFSINQKPTIASKKGTPLLTIVPYFEGKIIFLYPFEYVDSYKDGELLRWKLLEYIYTHPHYTIKPLKPLKKLKNKKQNKKRKKEEKNNLEVETI